MRLGATVACAAMLALMPGCGGDDEEFDPIPRRQANALVDQLDAVAELVPDRCGSARFQIGELEEKVADLPRGIDPDVRAALGDGLDRLRDLAEEECGASEDEETDTTETETDTVETETETETQPTETETQPTETEPPPQTETQPPQTETTPAPPGQNGGVPPGFEEGE